MTNDPRRQSSGAQWPPSTLSQGEAIRLLADEELSESEIRSICSEAFGEDTPARLQCERALRERVASIMRESAPAPAALRSAVEQICSQDDDEASSGRVEIDPAITRSHGFWSTARTLALAASLALVIGASFLLWPGNPASPFHQPIHAPFGDQRAQLAAFIDSEHDRCARLGEYFEQKFAQSTPEEARALIADHLGASSKDLSLEKQDYRMAGVSPCAVPGPGASVHVLYESISEPGRALSLFIQRAEGVVEAPEPGVCYCIPADEDDEATLQAWRKGGLIYFLYAGEGEPPNDVGAALAAPITRVRLSEQG